MSPDILGPHAGLVVGARALLKPRERRDRQLFLVEGPQAVREAVQAGVVRTILVDHMRAGVVDEFGAIADAFISPKAMGSITDTESPQGIVAICAMPVRSLDDVLRGRPETIVVCVSVQDPGNLGTIIRSAHAAGVDAVLTTTGTVDLYNSKVLRSTVGSLFHVPVVQALQADEIAPTLASHGIGSFGLAGGAEVEIFGIGDERLRQPTAWWVGSEAHGLPDDLRSRVEFVSIPMPGGAESLNVAVAASLAMYASVRARSPR